ncbi:MAG: hypothetical protein ACK5TX_13680 [Planctomyces sp.]|jgi:hypothetical protein
MSLNSLCRVYICVLAAFLLAGCEPPADDGESQEMAARLEFEMAAALDRFQNAENHFGPSTTPDDLPKNGHWLDRMLEALREVQQLEQQASSLGYSTNGISQRLRQRCQQHYESFQGDMKHLRVMVDLQLATELLEGL